MMRQSLGAIALLLLVSTGCQVSDAAITGAVKAQLAADDRVKALQINVDTENGVVTLSGNIDDPVAKRQAIQIAESTDGVKTVVDMLAFRRAGGSGDAPDPGRTLGEKLDDAGITAEVKARLLADPNVGALKLDVDTRDGVVFLTGNVKSTKERDRAIELVRETRNVRDVEANLKVVGS